MIDGRRVVYGFERDIKDACNLYRIKQPIDKIMEHDLFPANLSSNLYDLNDKDAWLDQADIIFTQLGKWEKLLSYMVHCKENKIEKKFVIDYDDNLFAVSPYNPSYFFHGYQEVDIELPDGSVRKIRDGQDGFSIEANKKLLTTFGLSLKMCDMIITPSPVLSGFYKRFNKNTRTIKNYLNLKTWSPLKLVKDDRVRIIWQGGFSHFLDMKEIQEALCVVMDKYRHVDLIIFGTNFAGITSGLPADRVVLEDWIDMAAYPYKLKTMNADIGIAPLANNEFNTCKSELKWEDYSALEIPCVASNIPPYLLAVNHGRDGFLCSDTKEWIDTLSALIESPEMRRTIGRQARIRMENDYDIDKNIYQYKDAFDSLYHKELIRV